MISFSGDRTQGERRGQRTFSFRRLLAVLAEHEVEFMVVGGLAGVLQGAPINTKEQDLLAFLEG